jgi:hypothetical protein
MQNMSTIQTMPMKLVVKRLSSSHRKLPSLLSSCVSSYNDTSAFKIAHKITTKLSKPNVIHVSIKTNKKQNPFQLSFQHPSYFSTSTTSTAVSSSTSNSTQNDRIIIKDMGEGIYNIQLNRPKKCNALDIVMFESIANTISQLQSNHKCNNKKNMDMRCIILSGNGRAFCTGLDVPSIIKLGNSDGMIKGGGVSMMMPHGKMNRLLDRPSGYDQRNNYDVDDMEDLKGIGNLAQDVAFLWRSLPVPVIA